MADKAKLTLPVNGQEQTIELPILVGTEHEPAVDIGQLRAKTGYVTLDPGYVNSSPVTSAITFLDGEQGILRYRGIPIDQLGEHSTFLETSFLLIHGRLPTQAELDRFSSDLAENALFHEGMKHILDGYPTSAHPMAVLSSMVCAMSAYYPEPEGPDDHEGLNRAILHLMGKVRTIAAFTYKKSVGEPYVYPQRSLEFCANFLHMMFGLPSEPAEVDPEMVKVMNLLLILHADHEQNCSTSTVRLVGSSRANLYASVSAGICALWGPLHGGANQEVIEMLDTIHRDGGGVSKFVDLAKDKNSNFRLMGFGHRVYKNYDPRARLIKKAADSVLSRLGVKDPLLDVARALEEAALHDPYFVDRKLYPNVDFYSGIIYRALGFPTNMFTVLFALGRLPGWIAQYKEQFQDKGTKIGRPRQIYIGETEKSYVPMASRF